MAIINFLVYQKNPVETTGGAGSVFTSGEKHSWNDYWVSAIAKVLNFILRLFFLYGQPALFFFLL